jgi:hypothetical protein
MEDLPEPVEQIFGVIYAPLGMVVEMLPDVLQQPVYAYMELWASDDCLFEPAPAIVAPYPATVPGASPTAPLPTVVGLDFDFTIPPSGAKGVLPIGPAAPVAKAPAAGTTIQPVSFETDADADEDQPATAAVPTDDDDTNSDGRDDR